MDLFITLVNYYFSPHSTNNTISKSDILSKFALVKQQYFSEKDNKLIHNINLKIIDFINFLVTEDKFNQSLNNTLDKTPLENLEEIFSGKFSESTISNKTKSKPVNSLKSAIKNNSDFFSEANKTTLKKNKIQENKKAINSLLDNIIRSLSRYNIILSNKHANLNYLICNFAKNFNFSQYQNCRKSEFEK